MALHNSNTLLLREYTLTYKFTTSFSRISRIRGRTEQTWIQAIKEDIIV